MNSPLESRLLAFPPRSVPSLGVRIRLARRDSCPSCLVEILNAPLLALHVVEFHSGTIEEAIAIVRERL